MFYFPLLIPWGSSEYIYYRYHGGCSTIQYHSAYSHIIPHKAMGTTHGCNYSLCRDAIWGVGVTYFHKALNIFGGFCIIILYPLLISVQDRSSIESGQDERHRVSY